jgi:hypothetical protein
MDASERLLLSAAHVNADEVGAAASRLMENTSEWQLWEREFGAAVRRVVLPARRSEQIRLLRLTGFSLIHSAVPFRHLRDSRLRGSQRRRIVSGLHGGKGYMQALVVEHRNFIRSTCSLACAAHLGEGFFADDIYAGSMARYETLYGEYFGAYCRASFSTNSAPGEAEPSLLPLLKLQVVELRSAILNYPESAGWLDKELQYRTLSGDTARLPQLR